VHVQTGAVENIVRRQVRLRINSWALAQRNAVTGNDKHQGSKQSAHHIS
jgi:hypothetical protein